MASQEPLLQSQEHRPSRRGFPSLSLFRHWAKGQPLRETESLDYEPIYNKVYFSRRKLPDRRFYGCVVPPCVCESRISIAPPGRIQRLHARQWTCCCMHNADPSCCLQVHWSHTGQVLCHINNWPHHRIDRSSMCSNTGVRLCAQAASSAVHD